MEKWCQEVVIHEAEKNKGLAHSIMDGVTKVVEQHGSIIVFEDDNELSSGTLSFLNNALATYEGEPKVMHISSYMFPVKDILPDTFFYSPTTCMGGWATWQRAWKLLERDPKKLLTTIEAKYDPSYFSLDGHYDFLDHLRANVDGRINSWAIRWQASVYIKGGLSLHPGHSLVRNVGFDETGVHSNWHQKPLFHHETLAEKIEIKPIPIEESKIARNAMKAHYDNHYNQSFIKKIRRKLLSGYYRMKNLLS